jgi:hypothetical protein
MELNKEEGKGIEGKIGKATIERDCMEVMRICGCNTGPKWEPGGSNQIERSQGVYIPSMPSIVSTLWRNDASRGSRVLAVQIQISAQPLAS